jgi:hypothetical protein
MQVALLTLPSGLRRPTASAATPHHGFQGRARPEIQYRLKHCRVGAFMQLTRHVGVIPAGVRQLD